MDETLFFNERLHFRKRSRKVKREAFAFFISHFYMDMDMDMARLQLHCYFLCHASRIAILQSGI